MAHDDDFDAWLLNEKRTLSDAGYAEIVATADRTKGRASGLLGIAVTLTTGCLAAASQSERHKAEAWVGTIGFLATSLLCIRVLYSTPWFSKNAPPDVVDNLLRDLPEKTEAQGRARMIAATEAISMDNAEAVRRDQRWLRRAWTVAALTPLFAGLAAALVKQVLAGWCAFLWDRMIER